MMLDLLSRLITMLAYRRPTLSMSQHAFIDRWIRPLGAEPDRFGNWILRQGTSRTVFSAHTDTVHWTPGTNKILYDGNRWVRAKKGPLGADDGVGCFLLVELAKTGKPGIYVWHDGEETGCDGSRSLVLSQPDWLAHVDRVIAFDRRGYSDVISHQIGRRTASDAFCSALADRLSALGLPYAPSDRGMYTDSESYADDIAECTNISVGYFCEHSNAEKVDAPFVLALLAALKSIDFETLPTERVPGHIDLYSPRTAYGSAYGSTRITLPDEDDCQWRYRTDDSGYPIYSRRPLDESADDYRCSSCWCDTRNMSAECDCHCHTGRKPNVWLYDDMAEVQEYLTRGTTTRAVTPTPFKIPSSPLRRKRKRSEHPTGRDKSRANGKEYRRSVFSRRAWRGR